MLSKGCILYLYAESPLHAGTGSGLGAIDLPLQREVHTGFPMIQGSGLKGALRAQAKALGLLPGPESELDAQLEVLFGPPPPKPTEGGGSASGSEHAGACAAGDVRLLLLPVRALSGVFAWVTCPFTLSRFLRDAALAGLAPGWSVPHIQSPENALWRQGSDNYVSGTGGVTLEEFSFTLPRHADDGVAAAAKIGDWLATNVIPRGPEYAYWRDRLPSRLVILHDTVFRDFCQFSTQVVTRVRLDDQTKTVEEGALWTEECLPTESVLYAALYFGPPRKSRPPVCMATAKEVEASLCKLDGRRLQVGGDETVGRGLLAIRMEGATNG